MSMYAPKSCLRLGIIALLVWLLFWCTAGTLSEFYIRHDYLKYYHPFEKIEPGMSRPEVHELVQGWTRDHHSERRAQDRGEGDVEVYNMCLQYEGGDFIRIRYEDSVVVGKEALSEGKNVLTDRDMLWRERVLRRNIGWLAVSLVFGSLGVVSLPLFCKRRRATTSDRAKDINALLLFVGGLLAVVGSITVVTISLLGSFWAALLLLFSP